MFGFFLPNSAHTPLAPLTFFSSQDTLRALVEFLDNERNEEHVSKLVEACIRAIQRAVCGK